MRGHATITLDQLREWGLKGLMWGVGILIIGDVLYLMGKALFWSPLRDQPKKPDSPQKPEELPPSRWDATVNWFIMLAIGLALWLWRDEVDWMDAWVGLPFLAVPSLWKARRILTWPLAAAWVVAGGLYASITEGPIKPTTGLLMLGGAAWLWLANQ